MANFTITGLSSGIDFDALIQGLLDVAREPIQLLEERKSEYENLNSLYQELNTKLLSLRTAVEAINLPSEFAAKSVTVADDGSTSATRLTASASGSATNGTHSIVIGQLAQAETEMHAGVASSTTVVNSSGGDLYFQYTYAGTQRTLTVPDGTTLEGLRDLINNDSSNPGVTASILNDGSGSATAYHLVLTGNDTGYTKNITIDSGTTLNGTNSVDFRSSTFTETQTAQSAVLNVDGFVTNNTFQAEIETHSGTGITDGTTVIYDTTTGTGDKVFEFTYGELTFTVTFTDDNASQYTLQNLVDVINGNSVSGITINRPTDGRVTASIVNTNQFRLTGRDSGVSLAITSNTTLDGTDGTKDFSSSQFTTTQTAQGIVKHSNTVTDAISGVTLNLHRADSSVTITLTVSTDVERVKEKINTFVDAYNDVMAFIYEQTKYDATTRVAGPLLGEATTRTVKSEVQGIVTGKVLSSGTYTSLSQIGIKTQSDGTLTVNDDDLSKALSANFTAVSDLFVNNGTTNGVAEQLRTKLNYLTSIVDGPVYLRRKGLGDAINDLQKQITRKEEELDRYEEQLRREFAALEALLSGLTAQGTFLSNQLSFM